MSRHLVILLTTALLALPAIANASSEISPLAWGKGIDWSNPLDGTSDETIISTSTIDLELDSDGSESSGDPREDRAILEFSLPGTAPQALLEFEIFGAVGGNVHVYGYVADGVLADGDFEETGWLLGTPLLTDASFSFDVTSAVATLIANGDDKIGFLIALTAEDQALSFWNVGYGQPEPRLTIIPEPGSGLLLGLAVVALAVGRRRTR